MLAFLAFGNNALGDELTTATGEGSSTTATANTYVDVASATLTITDVGDVDRVLVIATFEIKALNKNAHEAYFKIHDVKNNTDSQIIQRHLEKENDGDKGIGSVVYIFDVDDDNGALEFKLQHASDNSSYDNTTYGTIVVIALGTKDNKYQLSNDIKSISTGVAVPAASAWGTVTGLTTAAISLPVSGSILVTTSINNELTGGTVATGEWKLQQRKGLNGSWTDIGSSISRSIGSPGDIGIASLGLVVTDLPKDDYYFQLLHKGNDTDVETLNTTLVAVALAYNDVTNGGRAFPAFNTEVAIANTTSNVLTPALSQAGTPASNTNMYFYAQYNMQANAALDAPTFDMSCTGTSVAYDSQDQQRTLSSDSDIGAGASVGLATGLLKDESYTASVNHKSDGTITLTTSNIILSGFQTNDIPSVGYWMGGTASYLTTWNNTGNWADGVIPTSSTNVTIFDKTNDPIINVSASCNSLYIESSATLDINETKDLTVSGDLDNDGTFTVISSISGTGSLIVEGTATGNVVMERYIAAAIWGTWDDGWHQISSPVVDYAIESNFTVTPATSYDFYCWYESTNEWVNFKNTIAAPTWSTANTLSNGLTNNAANFLVGKGYMAAYETESTKSFSGEINLSDVVITNLTNSGSIDYLTWHLLGNPYSSGLSWDATWTTLNIGGTVQIWNESGQSYSAIAADPGGIIPATNGFMVEVTSATNILTIPESKRVHGGTFFKSAEFPLIKLKAVNMDYPSFQESQILFNPESTTGYEIEYDGNFLVGHAPCFFSKIDNQPMAVNSMPDYSENTVIPFTFIKNEGLNFSIEMYVVENMDLDVYLFDKKTNHEHNLSQNPVYTFTSFTGDNIERFEIRFKTVGIEEQDLTSSNIQIWSSNKTINILNPDHQKGTIRVINIYGQLLIESQLTGNDSQELSVNISTGNYIVNVIGDNKVTSKKIFVK